MGQAKSLEIRQQVVVLRKQGFTLLQISSELQLGLGTVKSIVKRYSTQGDLGLRTVYSNCGRRVDSSHRIAYRLVRLMKYLHPTWGVPFIRSKILEKFPQVTLQGTRHYQHLLFKDSDKLPPPILPSPIRMDRSRIAHDVWQIDAKERFSLLNGQEVCYLTISDESTGALIGVRAFPPWAYRSSAFRTHSYIFAGTI